MQVKLNAKGIYIVGLPSAPEAPRNVILFPGDNQVPDEDRAEFLKNPGVRIRIEGGKVERDVLEPELDRLGNVVAMKPRKLIVMEFPKGTIEVDESTTGRKRTGTEG